MIYKENTMKHRVHINALNIFEKYKPGENISWDGNCGIFICNALNDIKTDNIIMTSEIKLIKLFELPHHRWSDEELAKIVEFYNYDTYIFYYFDKTDIIFGKGNRPFVVLYNVNKNTHWTLGTNEIKKSLKIPNNFIYL